MLPGVAIATASTIGLLADRLETIPLWAPVTCVALVLVVIVSTAALQARQHARLAEGWSEALHRQLVRTNWIRVAAWSAAAALCLWMCSQTLINP